MVRWTTRHGYKGGGWIRGSGGRSRGDDCQHRRRTLKMHASSGVTRRVAAAETGGRVRDGDGVWRGNVAVTARQRDGNGRRFVAAESCWKRV